MGKHLAAHLVPTGIRNHSEDRPARNRWDPSDKVERSPKWRVVTD